MIRRNVFAMFSVAAVVAVLCAPASASIRLDLLQGSSNGFSFSFLHKATGSGSGRATNGSAKRLTGYLDGTYDSSSEVFSLTGSSLSLASNLTLDNGDVVTGLSITGGKLWIDNLALGAADFHGGFVNYVASLSGGGSHVGAFFFASRKETGSNPDGETPNSGTFDHGVINIAEWGNNWKHTTGGSDWSFLDNVLGGGYNAAIDPDDGPRMGIDLRGRAIPEPGTIAIWTALGLIGFVGYRRVRKVA